MAELTAERLLEFPVSAVVTGRMYFKKVVGNVMFRLGMGTGSTTVVELETLFNSPKAGGSSGTFSADLTQNIDFTVDLTGNLTINFGTDAPSGKCARYMFRIKQDATGGRAVTWNASGTTVTWQGGIAPIVADAPNEVTLIAIYWDGATYYGSKSCGYL